MGNGETHTNELLTIAVTEEDDSILVLWSGKSLLRKPGDFVTPILIGALARGSSSGKRIVLDFRSLEYMNSSTITPIIKVLDRARSGENSLTVMYTKSLKWQDLSFSALEIFETPDRRVEIKAKD